MNALGQLKQNIADKTALAHVGLDQRRDHLVAGDRAGGVADLNEHRPTGCLDGLEQVRQRLARANPAHGAGGVDPDALC